MLRLFKAAGCVLLLICLTFSASAYALSYTVEAPAPGLRWRKHTINIAISASLTSPNTNIKSDSDVAGAINRALATWEKAANIAFRQTPSTDSDVSPQGNAGDGVSLITIAQTPQNLLLFAKDAENASARTRVFFNRGGFITEADIVLNPYQQFSTDGSIGTFDLESTLTHEIGHLLGLDHSSVLGATMNENYGKNGVYNLHNVSSRTLSADDIASVRALYGTGIDDESCCGRITGKLTKSSGKAAKDFRVWAEDPDTGRVMAEVRTSADGGFRFDGLPSGEYRLFSQSEGKVLSAAEELGSITIEKAAAKTLTKKVAGTQASIGAQYLGFNGQLAELAVPLNAGRSYTLFVGGKDLDPAKVRLGSSSRFLSVAPESVTAHDYGDSITVLSFELKIAAETPLGEYSLFVESGKGARRFIVGGLTVEEYINPWSSGYVLAR
jgi:predicted Zn-dependent protease